MIYWDLFLAFLKVGCFSFGGAYGAIPLIRDVVLSYGWLSEDALADMIAISESTPGPIMVNLATYVGCSQAGICGAAIATAAVTLPAFVVVLLAMAALRAVLQNRYVQAALQSLSPCIIGIILATGCYMLLRNAVFPALQAERDVRPLLLSAFLALVYFGAKKLRKNGISPIVLILLSACGGVALYGIA